MLVFHLLFKNAATYNQSNASEKLHFYNLIQQNKLKKDPFHFPEQNSQFKQHNTNTNIRVCVNYFTYYFIFVYTVYEVKAFMTYWRICIVVKLTFVLESEKDLFYLIEYIKCIACVCTFIIFLYEYIHI